MAIATFGAGCFWGVEAAFADLPGVLDTRVGYMGGHVDDPGYDAVCGGDTGHAEVVEVEYDPDETTYQALLAVFWCVHDPTTPDQQGDDIGSQYRSVVFFHGPEQEALALASLEAESISGRHAEEIVTEIEPAGTLWVAEDEHQRFLDRR